MIFDPVYGLPKPNGASDYNDSSHLAGILAIVEHPEAVDCIHYVYTHHSAGKRIPYSYDLCFNADLIAYTRHPAENKYDFSRDQAWLLMVGLLKQGHKEYIDTDFITGKDIIYPSLKGIETIAKRGKPYFWQYLWAKLEVYIHAKFQPLEEPFQVIAACEAYGLYKFWTDNNKLWRWSIRRYLSQLDGAWRGEPELEEFVIQYVDRKIK